MKNIQEVFNQIQQVKKQIKEIKTIYRDTLTNNGEYQKVIEDLKTLKEKKRQLENSAKDDMGSEFTKLEGLETEMKSSKEILSDIAITQLMEGKLIEIKDEYNNLYEPKYAVTFKKTGSISAGGETNNQRPEPGANTGNTSKVDISEFEKGDWE